MKNNWNLYGLYRLSVPIIIKIKWYAAQDYKRWTEWEIHWRCRVQTIWWCACAGWAGRARRTDSEWSWGVEPVARTAPTGTHDDRAHARARRGAAVRPGRTARRGSQPALCHEERDLAMHMPPRGRRNWCHPSSLSTYQCLWRNRTGLNKQVQPRNQNRLGYLLLPASGFFRAQHQRAWSFYH